jgi:hypothetical protein
MNRRQTYVLLGVGLLIALGVIFPPYREVFISDGTAVPTQVLGYHPLMSPPEPENGSLSRIDYDRLLLQIGAVCAVGTGVYHLAGDTE